MFNRILIGQSESDTYWVAAPNVSTTGYVGRVALDDAKQNVYICVRGGSSTVDLQTAKIDRLGIQQNIINFGNGDTYTGGACAVKGNDWVHVVGTNNTYEIPVLFGTQFETVNNYRFHFTTGARSFQAANSVCASTTGRDGVYFCGQWFETMDGQPTGATRAWIGRCNVDGLAWGVLGPIGNAHSFTDVAMLPNGNVIAIGRTSDLGGISTYLIVFDPANGAVLQQKAIQSFVGRCIAVAPDGSVVIGGGFFNGNFYVAKYDASLTGDTIWRAARDARACSGIAIDSRGNTVCIASAMGTTPVVFKYSPDGTLLWQRTIYGPGPSVYQEGLGIAIGAGDCIYAKVQSGSKTLLFKIPGDGSMTGVYGDYTYAVSNQGPYPASPSGISTISYSNQWTFKLYNDTRGSFRTAGSNAWVRTIIQ